MASCKRAEHHLTSTANSQAIRYQYVKEFQLRDLTLIQATRQFVSFELLFPSHEHVPVLSATLIVAQSPDYACFPALICGVMLTDCEDEHAVRGQQSLQNHVGIRRRLQVCNMSIPIRMPIRMQRRYFCFDFGSQAACCQTQSLLRRPCNFFANKQGGPGRLGSAERTIARCCLPHRLVSPRPQHRHSQSKGVSQIRVSRTCPRRHMADVRVVSCSSFLCFTMHNFSSFLCFTMHNFSSFLCFTMYNLGRGLRD
jgi:hypothetical protein